MAGNKDNNAPTIIIKREGDEESSNHGGAWKIAYADFMTAMMTFFLLMWLLSITTDEQRHGIAKFFNPMADQVGVPSAFIAASPKASPVPSHKSEAIKTTVNNEPISQIENPPPKTLAPALILPEDANDIGPGIRTRKPPRMPEIVPIGGPQTGGAEQIGRIGQGHGKDEGISATMTENDQIRHTIANLKEALKQTPNLSLLQENLTFQLGSDEIRIEIRDTGKKPMFDTGSTIPNKDGVTLLNEVAKWLSSLPENISIMGETDGQPYHATRRRTGILSNWTLSTIRADRAREVLVQAGYPDRKIISVIGRADRDLAIPEDPEDPANRRIVIIIHRRQPLPKSFLTNESSQVPLPSSTAQPH